MGRAHRRDRHPVRRCEPQRAVRRSGAARKQTRSGMPLGHGGVVGGTEYHMASRQGEGRILTLDGGVIGIGDGRRRRVRMRRARRDDRTLFTGLIHVGPEQRPVGRHGEPPPRSSPESIRSFGVDMGRPEDRTPPRLDRKSIDFDARVDEGVFAEERGDQVPVPFSFDTTRPLGQPGPLLVDSHQRSHSRSRSKAHRAKPLFNGQIKGIGPRYCPSLEDKIMRF